MLGLKNDEGTNEQQNGRETFNAQHSTLKIQGNGKAMRAKLFLAWTANVQAGGVSLRHE